MKGLVLAELVDFAESRLRLPIALPRYDPVTHYSTEELLAVVGRIAEASGQDQAALLRAFGEHLFGRFAAIYPVFFIEAPSSTLAFLGGIDGYVHGEVKKIHPDAEFPSFAPVEHGPDRLELTYRSARPLADLAEGLLRGCVAHFGETIEVRREPLDGAPGTAARFLLTRTS